MKILFVASEVAPFAKTGGLADVAGSLPAALRRLGHDVCIATPAYRTSRERFALKSTGVEVGVPIAGFRESATILTAEHHGCPVWFVDHPAYYDRDTLYGGPRGDYGDNGERFGFFCAILPEICRAFDFAPQIVHANDWQCGLAPLIFAGLRRSDPFFADTASLFTIHNLGYQGHFPPTLLALLGLDPALFTPAGIEYYGSVSLLKAGIVASDFVTTVSPTYSREICTPEYGHGFDGILRSRRERLCGILNGIDAADWDPAVLTHPYSVDDLSGKRASKAALQQELGLAVDPEAFLIVMVSRLDRQKGFDLIEAVWPEMVRRPVQFALLGSGDAGLAGRFADHAAARPLQVALRTGFDEALSRRFYAGGDLFLMPSLYEPCGLSQLIALRYGTLPLVRRTGGLADTIIDPEDAPVGNGFVFAPYLGEALLQRLDGALALWRKDQTAWQAMQRQAMRCDFSWESSAARYVELYQLAGDEADVRF